ncbi:MAG TPA: GntR family transcriptional regulator [Acidimicrobiales bacterium]|nr:GntR family transcriptional regulator [Acidimicrobiales bacterium]
MDHDGLPKLDGALIHFRLDPRTGVPAYRQLVDQVRHGVRLGVLQPGDQLPSVREVVTQISINPNTVHRAYRELEAAGLAEGRPGLGTFVLAPATPPITAEHQTELQDELDRWVGKARAAGVDDEGIQALVAMSLLERDDRNVNEERVAR